MINAPKALVAGSWIANSLTIGLMKRLQDLSFVMGWVSPGVEALTFCKTGAGKSYLT